MSHEQSITVGIDEKFYNISTVIGGKKVTNKKAIDSAIKTESLGKWFATHQEAVQAARKRSKSFSKPRTFSSPKSRRGM